MPCRSRDYYHESAMVHAIYSQPWVLCPSKCSEIEKFLHRRFVLNERFDEDDMRSQFGVRMAARRDDDDEHPIIDGVQVVDCIGLLAPRMNLMMRYSGGTSTQRLTDQILAAGRNEAVSTILIRGDSPGGAASGVPEVAEALERVAEEGTRTVAYFSNECASGAFWIASACQHFVCSTSTHVGSHGVYWIHRSDAAMNRTNGQTFEVIRAGRNKGIGNPYEDLTPESRAVMQERVDAIMAEFTDALARGRRVDTQVVLDTYGQGKSFLAAEALQRGMIDAIGTFDDVLADERERRMPQRRSQTVSTSETFLAENVMSITERIRAALYARGLIATFSSDSDDYCRGIIASMNLQGTEEQILNGINQYKPESQASAAIAVSDLSTIDDDNGDGVMVGRPLSGRPVAPQPDLVPVYPQPRNCTSASAQSATTDVDVERIRKEATEAEQHRQATIRARGGLLGLKSEDINEAIEQGLSVSDAMDVFTRRMAERSPSISSGIDIQPGPAAADKFADAASETMLLAAGGALARTAEEKPVQEYGGSLQHKRPIDLCRMELQLNRIQPTGDNDSDALAWLQMIGTGEQILAADGGSVNTPGAHPDMLSSLVSKVFNRGLDIAEVTYSAWCARMEDLPDLKPRSIMETGVFGELDDLDDDEEPKEKKFDSQLSGWIQARRKGNKVGLTPVMVANDDMGGFARQLSTLSAAGPETLNRLCLDLLAGNVTLVDGTALFHADHNNLIDTGSGGVPGAAQASEMRLKHRRQKNIGEEGSNLPINWMPRIALLPAAHEQEAKQTFMTNVYDAKTAQTDANINTVRNEITPVIEARLDDYSALEWYTFVNPDRYATIAYAFQRGWGSMGRRTTWFEPGRGTRYWKLETRFAAAAVGFRGAVKNAGN